MSCTAFPTLPTPPIVVVKGAETRRPRCGGPMSVGEILPQILCQSNPPGRCQGQTLADGPFSCFGKRVTLLQRDIAADRFGHDKAARALLTLGLGVEGRPEVGGDGH